MFEGVRKYEEEHSDSHLSSEAGSGNVLNIQLAATITPLNNNITTALRTIRWGDMRGELVVPSNFRGRRGASSASEDTLEGGVDGEDSEECMDDWEGVGGWNVGELVILAGWIEL